MSRAPLVGLPSDSTCIGLHRFQAVAEKYIRAILDATDCLPLLIPSMSPPIDPESLLQQLDGLFLTGAYSNIEPRHYSDQPSYEGNLHDPARDAGTLSLVPLAIRMRVPVFAVCRGIQEVNVALGGTLHQKVHEVEGLHDHREDLSASLDIQYSAAHPVALSGGLALLAGGDSTIVNSLHGQGIDRLGRGLLVEARAADGLVEAVRLDSPDTFLLAVQWHPEWKVTENPFYQGLFEQFAAACRTRAAQRG